MEHFRRGCSHAAISPAVHAKRLIARASKIETEITVYKGRFLKQVVKRIESCGQKGVKSDLVRATLESRG